MYVVLQIVPHKLPCPDRLLAEIRSPSLSAVAALSCEHDNYWLCRVCKEKNLANLTDGRDVGEDICLFTQVRIYEICEFTCCKLQCPSSLLSVGPQIMLSKRM